MIKNNAEDRTTGTYRLIQQGSLAKVTVGRQIKSAASDEVVGPSLMDEIGDELALSMMAEAVQEAIEEDRAAGLSRIVSIEGIWHSVDPLGHSEPLEPLENIAK